MKAVARYVSGRNKKPTTSKPKTSTIGSTYEENSPKPKVTEAEQEAILLAFIEDKLTQCNNLTAACSGSSDSHQEGYKDSGKLLTAYNFLPHRPKQEDKSPQQWFIGFLNNQLELVQLGLEVVEYDENKPGEGVFKVTNKLGQKLYEKEFNSKKVVWAIEKYFLIHDIWSIDLNIKFDSKSGLISVPVEKLNKGMENLKSGKVDPQEFLPELFLPYLLEVFKSPEIKYMLKYSYKYPSTVENPAQKEELHKDFKQFNNGLGQVLEKHKIDPALYVKAISNIDTERTEKTEKEFYNFFIGKTYLTIFLLQNIRSIYPFAHSFMAESLQINSEEIKKISSSYCTQKNQDKEWAAPSLSSVKKRLTAESFASREKNGTRRIL
jgi:hypothetical protein